MEASTSTQPLSRDCIRDNDSVLIRLPSGSIKPVKISLKGSVGLGKYGSFQAKDLIGKPYGETYEITTTGGLIRVEATLTEIEETAANNENIGSQGLQKLTFVDIEALKNEGVSGRDIIAKQIEEHSAYELKTEYSKDKYMKRKEAKYLQMFTVIEPTVHNVCQYQFDKHAENIRDIRPDVLSQMMAHANVRPGGKLMIIEDVHGLVVSAAVERMGGKGQILIINDADSPPDLHMMDNFNFTASQTSPITSIHWAATQASYVPPVLPLEIAENTPKSKNVREQAKVKRRKELFEKSQQAREDYLNGGFDAVIIACQYEPFSILEKILPSLAGSAAIVIQSPYLQVLFNAQSLMRPIRDFLSPSIVEPWLRKYQVLPGRTHPEMQGMGHGGYLLISTRVFDDPSANSSVSRKKTKRKIEAVVPAVVEGSEAKVAKTDLE